MNRIAIFTFLLFFSQLIYGGEASASDANEKNLSLLWEIFYNISTYILALVAIVTLWRSVLSGREISRSFEETRQGLVQVSEAVSSVRTSLVTLSTPLIKIINYDWMSASPTIDCGNPPIGIRFAFRNVSNVPAVVHKISYELYFGEKRLDTEGIINKKPDAGASFVVPPGELGFIGAQQREAFSKYLSVPKQNIWQEPNLFVQVLVEYSAINSKVGFRYSGRYEIAFNCATPQQTGMTTKWEKIEEVEIAL